MWGIEHWGVEPDIMTMAKGIANGLPLGVTIATPEIAASLKALTISTFGGNPVSLRRRERDAPDHRGGGPAGQRRADGARCCARAWRSFKRRFPKAIGDVRGMGLMQAIELVADETAGDRTPEPAMTQPRLRRGEASAGS